MSFQYKTLTYKKKPYKQKQAKYRKEKKDSFMVNHFPKINFMKKERASAFTSKGSLTLEAAVVVPLFFFSVLCFVYLLEMMAIQTTVRNAIYSTGREVAQKAYASTGITTGEIERCVIENIGTERLDRSIIVGGRDGIDCSDSVFHQSTGVIDLSVKYAVEIPILMFRIPAISCEENLRVKGWNGYVLGISSDINESKVYVTDTGLVYHADANCTYLDLSVRSVAAGSVSELRNQSGAKYYACESCKRSTSNQETVYVTDYGTRYHTSLECKKIKRNVYAVSLDEVYGLGGCSKCVK